MPRGFERAVYVNDRGERFWLYVDADYLLQPDRGFTPLGTEPLRPFPGYWTPRYVVGVDALGNRQVARIGNVSAPLWTGSTLTWSFEASDRTVLQATRVARVGERTSR